MKKLNFILLSGFVFALLLFGCSKEPQTNLEPQELEYAELTFAVPVSFSTLHAFEERYNIKVNSVTVTTQVAGQEWTEVLALQTGQTVLQAQKYLDANFRDSNNDLINNYETAKDLPNDERNELVNYYKNLLTAPRSHSQVTRSNIAGSKENILLLQKAELNAQVDFVNDLIQERLRVLDKKTSFQAIDRAPPTWVPNTGTLTLGAVANSTTDRYANSTMKWKTLPVPYSQYPFNGYANATYEHDLFLNNYSNNSGTYLTRAVNNPIDRIPVVVSAISNLPSAYLDTRFWDGPEEVAYTIGCGNANSIVRGTIYTNYLRMAKGDVNTDKAKLFAQRGHQSPSGCTSTWCSFGDENYTILQAWQAIPATYNWTN